MSTNQIRQQKCPLIHCSQIHQDCLHFLPLPHLLLDLMRQFFSKCPRFQQWLQYPQMLCVLATCHLCFFPLPSSFLPLLDLPFLPCPLAIITLVTTLATFGTTCRPMSSVHICDKQLSVYWDYQCPSHRDWNSTVVLQGMFRFPSGQKHNLANEWDWGLCVSWCVQGTFQSGFQNARHQNLFLELSTDTIWHVLPIVQWLVTTHAVSLFQDW